MRRQTHEEYPDASGSVALADARTRLSVWWDEARTPTTQPRAAAPPAAGGDLASQLAGLAQLHASGELTDEEYAAAKARILSG
jgi:hypothetical protein